MKVTERSVIAEHTAGMTTAKWRAIPATLVPVHQLVATQTHVSVEALFDPTADPHSQDHLPHVVELGGTLFLEDGHHRAVRAKLAGVTQWIPVRILHAAVPA